MQTGRFTELLKDWPNDTVAQEKTLLLMKQLIHIINCQNQIPQIPVTSLTNDLEMCVRVYEELTC